MALQSAIENLGKKINPMTQKRIISQSIDKLSNKALAQN